MYFKTFYIKVVLWLQTVWDNKGAAIRLELILIVKLNAKLYMFPGESTVSLLYAVVNFIVDISIFNLVI